MLESIAKLPDPALPLQVAKALHCSQSYIQARCQDGEIRSSKIAGRYLIPRDAVQEYVKAKEMKKCQKETGGLISSGEKIGNAGTYAGETTVGDAKSQRALQAANKLKKPSSNSSQGQNQQGRVIHLNAQ
jgi:excisionase family DNA binding protein